MKDDDCWMVDAECWMKNPWMLDAGCWIMEDDHE